MATNLDSSVEWLLHSNAKTAKVTESEQPQSEAQGKFQFTNTEPTPPQSPVTPTATPVAPSKAEDIAPHEQEPPPPVQAPAPVKEPQQPSPAQLKPQSPNHPVRPSLAGRGHSDNSPGSKGPVGSLKKEKDGRRSSWISSLSSKFGSSTDPKRNTSVDSTSSQKVASPKSSPAVEFGNPFDSKMGQKDPKLQDKKEENKKPLITSQYTPPRRQSVLVAAGKETKLEQPGFLSSALRRLSSSSNAHMGKGAGQGAICPRKVMNLDQNRERIKIQEFDQNKLKRVAFCVDVEIAGYAAQADEDPQQNARPPMSGAGQRASLSGPSMKKDSKDAKYKEKGEGAALKNPEIASAEKDTHGQTSVDAAAAAEAKVEAKEEAQNTENGDPKLDETQKSEDQSEPQPIPTTRKKEKKKRSEAERKERREKKRRHAEKNGLVPLELTRDDDDDSDSSPGSTPPGATTPRKGGDSPTTDPLRIYKRCCQLRETTVLSKVKEQISKPAATLAEAPGTVAIIDLSGTNMQLQDITTFGDWLAVVPVRKLVLNDCNLSDEALRIILSGLSGCKSSEQTKANRKLPKRSSGKSGKEQMGVIEKLSLKNNSAITNIGWKHIALFMHMSHSLRAIDLSGIPFPKSSGDLSRTTTASSGGTTNGPPPKTNDIGALITRAIAERMGDRLEELIMSGCGLSTQNVADIVDAAIKCKIRRLGLAGNALDQDALTHVVRYIKTGTCEGLDLGGINLHGTAQLVANALDANNPLFAISFADCKLDADDLTQILKPLAALKNLKFIDLSQNPELFKGTKNAVPIIRKLLPRLKELKRIHFADCGLTSDHVIALAEILPDCPAMCHLSILENEPLIKAMNSKDGPLQEEACAYFASLMTAVRVSQTIVAIEIEVPSNETNEVIKALASQVVAYSLRNMERGVEEFGVKSNTLPDKDAPEVLLHLVGHMEGYKENHDNDEPAPDEDYVIASTGIVKALGVCLGTKDTSRTHTPRNASPTASGPGTPRQGPFRPRGPNKPRDVSLELCESARKIRMRLRPALIKEDKAGNDIDYRRLLFLDQTLQRMIQRFEDEYPETKIPPLPASEDLNGHKDTLGSSLANESVLSASTTDDNNLSQIPSGEDYIDADQENRDPYAIKLSRTSSNTSLAAKAYTNEEGRMHRFGQELRREVLRPTGMTDHLHGVDANDIEPEHLAKLRARLDEYKGEEIRQRVENEGAQSVIEELGMSAKELAALKRDDPEGFEKFEGGVGVNGTS